MHTITFKTNLKCNGCVNTIKPGMDNLEAIRTWRVFLDVENKTLEVEYENTSEDEISKRVIDTVTKAGYQITKL